MALTTAVQVSLAVLSKAPWVLQEPVSLTHLTAQGSSGRDTNPSGLSHAVILKKELNELFVWLCLVLDTALKEKYGLIAKNPKKSTRVDGQRCSNEETTGIKLGLIILKEKLLACKERAQNKTCQLFSSLCKIIEGRNDLFSTSVLDTSAVLIAIRIVFQRWMSLCIRKDCSRWCRSLHHYRSLRTV